MKQSPIHKDLRTPKYRMKVEEDLKKHERYERKAKHKPRLDDLLEDADMGECLDGDEWLYT